MNAVDPSSAPTNFKIQACTEMLHGTPSSAWGDLVMSDFNGFLECSNPKALMNNFLLIKIT